MPRWNSHFQPYVELRDPELLQLVARVEALAGLVRAIPLPPALRAEADRLNILRAVRGTTGIEGANLTEAEVGDIIAAGQDGEPVLGAARAREEAEARNAARVMDYIRDTGAAAPDSDLTEDQVREMHALTTAGIDYRNNSPGEYRARPVAAGDYQAPPPAEVPELMARFFEWLPLSRDRDTWPECVRAVAAHFYLISIHPFGDGNGRTSRAAESFILYSGGVDSLGFYSLANFYYRRRPEYIEMLDRARFVHNGDLTEFVKFALRGLREELEDVHAEALQFVRVLAFTDHARQALQVRGGLRSKTGERRLELVLQLTGEPVPIADLRARRHAAALPYAGVTNKTLTRDINYLRDMGLIRIENGHARANLELMNQFSE